LRRYSCQRVYYCTKLRMLCSYDDLYIICTVLLGRYCVMQHSCCNTDKTIIIIIIISFVLRSKILLLLLCVYCRRPRVRQDSSLMPRRQVQRATMRPAAWLPRLAQCYTPRQRTTREVALAQTAVVARLTPSQVTSTLRV